MKSKKRFKKIYIEITNKCNLNCTFCPTTTRKKENMLLDKFEHVLNEIKNCTDYIYLHIKGEPLMHPDLDKILDKCYEYGIMVNITTNGTLLKEKQEILISKKAIRQINISLHDLDKTYIDVLKVAKDIGQKTDIIIQFRLWNLVDNKIDEKNDNIIKLVEKVFNKSNILDDIKTNSIKLDNKVFLNFANKFAWPDLEINKIATEGTCYGLRDQIGILVDGTVVPCCLDNNGDINLGNIFDISFEEILEKPIVKKIIKGFQEGRLEEDLCKKCGYAHIKRM